ncbi:DUF3305 domain-containing protein [Propylenella binzhouense]|uniref:DUF3305 domain-containing protein n=1 Tax=Propylenella binzhouense TaxID=2555902 RepID=A0A964WVJ8_9HYPH|nr:DUF3305 domain-containing protein [Propylenella binzhouense]MYZ50256.1 DUF3305 domain-containing protein [Propylenella binzhouense]
MAESTFSVGIVVERRPLRSIWADHAWVPVAALPAPAAAEAWTLLSEEDGIARFYAGAADIALHHTETAHYRDNLLSGAPALWVVLQASEAAPGVALFAVTADPTEGEGYTETGAEIVDPVPMPAAVQARVAAFVAEHHVERAFFKRKRDTADPEALALRPARGRPPGTGR